MQCNAAAALLVNTSAPAARNWAACAESHSLPFAGATFDLVICHHSLEHFPDAAAAIREIRRVLKPDGRLFVSVPEGASLTDRLYRLLLCGGGHFQRFTFDSLVSAVESGTGLHLAAWRELTTSFIYLKKGSFTSFAHPPRRMRLLGRLPAWCFGLARLGLNVGSRLADRCFGAHFARYGWAFGFVPEVCAPIQEQAESKVCMSCGSAPESVAVERVFGVFYRCPYCRALNVGV